MPAALSPHQRGGLFQGLISQQSVLRALILRELQARFGRDNIGYLWVIAEPMMLATGVTLLHLAVNPGNESSGIGVYPFTVLGYCIFIIFRNNFNRAEGMLLGSSNLLYHSQITLFDIILSKTIVESLAASSALVVLMFAGTVLGLAEPPARVLYFVLALFAMMAIALGLSMLLASVAYRSHVVGRLAHPFSYIMFPLSGAFITMNFLPAWARPYMAWNPLMSLFELARYGYFASATDRYIYPRYLFAVCCVTIYIGLLALRRVREHINAS